MISDEIKRKIEELFSKKKYQELIDVADKFIKPKERPPGLACMIGTCKFLKENRTKEDLLSSLDYFEEAYLKDKITINGLSGVTNFMNVSVIGAKKSIEFIPYLNKSEKFYKETEKFFSNNINFLIAAKNLFWFQLNNQKIKEISEKIILNKNVSLIEKSGSIFNQNYFYNLSQQEYTKYAVNNSKSFPKYNVKELKKINFKENKKINLGFVSGDFTDQHSIFYFLKDTLKFFDKKIFKIFLFSFNRGENAKWLGQKEIKNLPDEFIHLDNYNNQECVDIIQEKKINILIDLMGFSFTKRVGIFNSRVAPVQISWLATCNTVGFENIDYLIADENVINSDEEKFYPEKILKMPNIWNAHCGYDFDRKFYNSPCQDKDIFTFGSLNNFHKVSDEVVEAWSQILLKTSKSKLVLKSSSADCNIEIMRDKFKKFGIDKKLIILDQRKFPYKNDHISVYKDIDLALDTFPYNGVTTTFESLWMGVPVIVLKGFNFNSRCGYSIIKNTNFEMFISKDIDDYVQKAIYFYENREEFLELKKKLYENILSTTLFDTKKFSEDFQKSLITTHKKINL